MRDEPLGHGVEVGRVEPPYPRPAVALVRLDQPQILALLHRDAALRRGWTGRRVLEKLSLYYRLYLQTCRGPGIFPVLEEVPTRKIPPRPHRYLGSSDSRLLQYQY